MPRTPFAALLIAAALPLPFSAHSQAAQADPTAGSSTASVPLTERAKFFGNPTKGNADQVPRGARIPALGGLRRCKSSP